MQADVLQERWTPTAVQATFAIHDLPSCNSKSREISIHLPLPDLGWTFGLSVAPRPIEPAASDGKKVKKTSLKQTYKWFLSAFSFRQHDRKILWGTTLMRAHLSLKSPVYDEECSPHTSSSDVAGPPSLCTIQAVLADTPSVLVPLETSLRISSSRPTKVWLTVAISECPLPKGLFQARSHHGSEAEVQTRLVKQCGDRVLSRSLTTGKLFDVKFLSCSTRSTPGSTGKLLPTYASLSVLEKHIIMPDGELKDKWTSALVALDDHDNANSELVAEVSFTDDEHELVDSDYDDGDEDPFPVKINASSLPKHDLVVTLEAKQPENSIERSWSPVELDGASDHESVDNDHQEDRGEPSHLSSGATFDHERTILVKFAAHRTWHAFLWYCYTGHVEFSRLKSQVKLGDQCLPLTHLLDGPPSCSPKSMYRLAELVGNDDLKAKALRAIADRMAKENILDETFSIFTSKHPDVREAQLGILMEHIGSPEVKEAFLEKMKKFGDMPHAKPVLLAFCDRLAV